MYFDAPGGKTVKPDPRRDPRPRPLTPTQDAFMLACRDEVERNGVLFGNELQSRLSGVELPITPWSEDKVKRRQVKRLLTYNAGAYGLFFNDKVPKKKNCWYFKRTSIVFFKNVNKSAIKVL